MYISRAAFWFCRNVLHLVGNSILHKQKDIFGCSHTDITSDTRASLQEPFNFLLNPLYRSFSQLSGVCSVFQYRHKWIGVSEAKWLKYLFALLDKKQNKKTNILFSFLLSAMKENSFLHFCYRAETTKFQMKAIDSIGKINTNLFYGLFIMWIISCRSIRKQERDC